MPTFYQPHAGMGRDKMKVGDILINTSTFSPAHCGVVVTGLDVIHATGKGIRSDDIDIWSSEADLFRMTPELSKAEADAVSKMAMAIQQSGSYGKSRAVFQSTFGSSSAGSGLNARLEKYRQRLEEDQGVVKNVYCSDLVIMSYQLACITAGTIDAASHAYTEGKVDDTNRMFIKLDGKHCWPSTLRRYLKASGNWSYLGEFKPQKHK